MLRFIRVSCQQVKNENTRCQCCHSDTNEMLFECTEVLYFTNNVPIMLKVLHHLLTLQRDAYTVLTEISSSNVILLTVDYK